MDIRQINEELDKILNEREYIDKKDLKNYVHSSGITNTEQDKFYIKHDFPVKGNVYHLNIDFYYGTLEDIKDMFAEEDIDTFEKCGFIKEYKGKPWLIFPKGTRVIYLGSNMSGGVYDIKGVEVEVSFWYDEGTGDDLSDEEALI